MIIKSYELKKLDINKNKYVLFYGVNEGAKTEEIKKIISLNKNITITSYDEKEILDSYENFYNNIFSKSLFDDKKVIIIKRATDKIVKIIEEIIEKDISDIYLIFNSDNLEKKSKLRSLFEKNKKLVCVPFYADTADILSRMAYNFFKEKKISISQANINLIVNKCNGDRGILKNELLKVEFFCQNKKEISSDNLLKLVNLVENHSISELIDNCLAKNEKKTMSLLNENNFNSEDCIIITRTFLNKSKKILKLSKEYQINKDLNKTIASARPPIFWKDKEIVKQQINKWAPNEINELIFDLNKIELQIKKNYTNSINIISDFILNQSS
jgi:DNA polymerase-3 subunit delta